MANIEKRSVDKDMGYALKLLSISPRTEKEMALKLKARGCGPDTSGRVIEFLKKQRLIDDLAYAKELIASRMRDNPRGKYALEHELKQKGIAEGTIAEAFERMEGSFDEKEMAERLAMKKMSERAMRTGANVRGRLYRFLASKGFDPDTVDDAVRKVLNDNE